jgi:hypothetical protein
VSFPLLVLTFINNVDAKCRESSGKGVFQVERLAKAEARGNRAYNGNQRIVYGDLPYRVATEQFVVECKSNGRDGYQQYQADNAEHIDIGQRTTEGKPRDDEQQASDAEAIARSYENIYPSA